MSSPPPRSKIAVSSTIEDKGSVFQARAVKLHRGDVKEIEGLLDEITSEKKVFKASHPAMYAWTFRSSSQVPAPSAAGQAKHDGGESGAGQVLAQLLETLKIENALVVVTRWYGGTSLGPARFRHISSVAREALRFLDPPPDNPGPGRKVATAAKGSARASRKKQGK